MPGSWGPATSEVIAPPTGRADDGAMTTTTPAPTTTTDHAATARSTRHLRQLRTVLGVDAAVCTLLGVAGLASAASVHDDLGLATATPLVLLAALLLPYAAGLVAFARGSDRMARTGGTLTALGDAGWVLATVVLLAAGPLAGAGVALAVVLAVAVAGIGIEKALALR